MKKKPPLILFGASFDPPHWGHIKIVHFIATQFKDAEIRLIPTGYSWQKNGHHATAQQRLEMLYLCQPELPRQCVIDSREIVRTQNNQSASYTVGTLRELRAEVGLQRSLIWILGEDQYQNLHTWHEWQDLFNLSNFVVFPRASLTTEQIQWRTQYPDIVDECQIEQLPLFASGKISFIDHQIFNLLPNASSDIRAGDLSQTLANITAYIRQHGLYSIFDSKSTPAN